MTGNPARPRRASWAREAGDDRRDDSVEEVLRTMKDHKVGRLPVIDGHALVGIVSQGDLATEVSEEQVGALVEVISAAP
jgi:CBS domain-containing protein